MVNREFERRFLAGESAVGRSIRFRKVGTKTEGDYFVAGVVGDVRHFGRDEEAPPVIFISYLQYPRGAMTLAVRTTAHATGTLDAIRREVQALDHNQPIYDVASMEERLSGSLSSRRFNTSLLLIFAMFALILAGIGLYGVMSYWVGQRTQEIGVRMALGAERSSVIALVMREAAALTAKGLGAGLAGAWLLTRSIQKLLFDTSPQDFATFLFVPVALLAGALLAAWIPAARAARVDPMTALRHE